MYMIMKNIHADLYGMYSEYHMHTNIPDSVYTVQCSYKAVVLKFQGNF